MIRSLRRRQSGEGTALRQTLRHARRRHHAEERALERSRLETGCWPRSRRIVRLGGQVVDTHVPLTEVTPTTQMLAARMNAGREPVKLECAEPGSAPLGQEEKAPSTAVRCGWPRRELPLLAEALWRGVCPGVVGRKGPRRSLLGDKPSVLGADRTASPTRSIADCRSPAVLAVVRAPPPRLE